MKYNVEENCKIIRLSPRNSNKKGQRARKQRLWRNKTEYLELLDLKKRDVWEEHGDLSPSARKALANSKNLHSLYQCTRKKWTYISVWFNFREECILEHCCLLFRKVVDTTPFLIHSWTSCLWFFTEFIYFAKVLHFKVFWFSVQVLQGDLYLPQAKASLPPVNAMLTLFVILLWVLSVLLCSSKIISVCMFLVYFTFNVSKTLVKSLIAVTFYSMRLRPCVVLPREQQENSWHCVRIQRRTVQGRKVTPSQLDCIAKRAGLGMLLLPGYHLVSSLREWTMVLLHTIRRQQLCYEVGDAL